MPVIERNRLFRVRYAGKDFDSFFDDMVERAKTYFDTVWNDFVQGQAGTMFLDLSSYGLDGLAWLLDRATNNAFLSTGRVRSYVSRIARQQGYKPGRAVPASADLQVSLGAAYGFDVPLPVGYQFRATDAGWIYETTNAVTWLAGDTTAKTVGISEGATKSAVFISDGTANQRFVLPGIDPTAGEYLLNGLTVTVDGVLWTEVDLLTVAQINQVEGEYDENPPRVRFGNGYAGNIPTNLAEIRVNYRVAHGTQGNVAQGQVVTPVRPLIVSGNTIALVVTQPAKATGGDGPESLDSIKANAPRYYAARNVAVVEDDYLGLAAGFSDSQYGRVACCAAIATRSGETDPELQAEVVVLTDAWTGLQTGLQALIDLMQVQTVAQQASLDDLTDQQAAALAAGTVAATVASQVRTQATLLSSYASSLVSQAGTVDDLCDDILATTPAAPVIALTNQIKALAASLTVLAGQVLASAGALGTPAAGATTLSNDLTLLAADLQSTLTALTTQLGVFVTDLATEEALLPSADATILAAIADIEAHVAAHWSAASEANLVSLPILARDVDGFYAAPSLGLVAVLQTFLDARKEVTQTINVCDGSAVLVLATVAFHVKVATGYVATNVLAQVVAAAMELLRNRAFGDDLSLQSFYDLKESVAGVERLNVTLGPADHLDSLGNLTIGAGEVVTRGSVTAVETT